jgi:glycosyltransferase-like protein
VTGRKKANRTAAPPLSIGLFTYTTRPRGSVVHTADLADALTDAGCDVTVYALDPEERGFFRPLRAQLALIPAAAAPRSTSELLRQRTRELTTFVLGAGIRHDIHHAGDALTANGLLDLRAQGHPLEVVRTVHHVERFDDAFLAQCQDRSIRKANLCLAVSAATERDVALTFGVQCRRVTNGVVMERFTSVDPKRVATWRQRLPAGAGPLLLAVGGVEARKNTVRILRAFARLRRRFSQAQLWIAGGATVLDHSAYRAEFDRELGLLPPATRAAVVELGVVGDDDLPALYRLANVLTLPSLQEGFGLAALEALSSGLAVVVSNRAPFTEYLDQGCATLVDPLSDQSIADGVVHALSTSAAARQAGRLLAETHTWSRVAELHLEHYERLLASTVGRRDDGSGGTAATAGARLAVATEPDRQVALRRIGLRPARA